MKTVIRLTEGDLHRIVRESVNKVLNETGYNVDQEQLANFARKIYPTKVGRSRFRDDDIKKITDYPEATHQIDPDIEERLKGLAMRLK